MSRGGRGGRRGGNTRPRLPWEPPDDDEEYSGQPQALYPDYDLPSAAPLSTHESAVVSSYLQFRSSVHFGPLYTQPRHPRWQQGRSISSGGRAGDDRSIAVFSLANTSSHPLASRPSTTDRASSPSRPSAATAGPKRGLMEQMQQDPATIDPFLSVPSYGQKFEPQVRELPRLGELRAARSVFPRELRGLLPGGTGILEKDAKRRIVAPPPSAVQRQRASQLAVAVATGELGGNAAAATVAAVAVDEDGGEEEEGKRREEGDIDLEEVDEVYDDEDAGDYDAEQYFETGEASEEEFGGGGEDGGDYF